MGLYVDEKTGELFIHEAGMDSILRILEVAFKGEIFKDASAVNLMLGGQYHSEFNITPEFLGDTVEREFLKYHYDTCYQTLTMGLRRAELNLQGNKLRLTLYVGTEFLRYADVIRELGVFAEHDERSKNAKAINIYNHSKTDVLRKFIEENISKELDFYINTVVYYVSKEDKKDDGVTYFLNAGVSIKCDVNVLTSASFVFTGERQSILNEYLVSWYYLPVVYK